MIASPMIAANTMPCGPYFEVEMEDVLRKKFSSGEGVLSLSSDMSDEMLLLCLKQAISLSEGKAFVVVPASRV